MGLREVQLAALLHDIGKFWQRAGGKGKHPKLSNEFIDRIPIPQGINKELVKTLVLRHHDMEDYPDELRVSGLPKGSLERSLARIVSEADNLSSAMDRDVYEEGEAFHPLVPIFLDIQLESEKKGVNGEYYYEPKILRTAQIFSKSGAYNKDKIEKVCSDSWDNFFNEIKTIPTKYFNAWFNTLNFLLKKHASFVLSAGYKVKPDVPLYDHLKTTAAIAHSLYFYWKESKTSPSDKQGESRRYLLILGDISGIQDFIYKISNPQTARKGMAKRLRGRSFWVSLIMDGVATKIIEELNLNESNLLWDTGGHFLIISPNMKRITEKLEDIRREVNKWLFDSFHGDLYLALHWKECCKNDLLNFGAYKEILGWEVGKYKRKKFLELFNKDFFKLRGENEKIEKRCSVCGRNRIYKENVCKQCLDHQELGEKIAKADYIIRGKHLGSPHKFFDIEYDFIEKENLSDYLRGVGDKVTAVYRWNNTEFLPEIVGDYPVTYGFKFLGKLVPLDEKGDILSFDDLAQLSKGAKKIGILKADVDDLGLIFAEGLKGERDRRSISRTHNLSFMFDLFFGGYLNEICNKYHVFYSLCSDCKSSVAKDKIIKIKEETGNLKYTFYDVKEEEVCDSCGEKKTTKLYINYSGGDDLLIIGPWDTILEVSTEIREEFKLFTCQNKDINISAGVAIVDPKFPISRAVDIANRKLGLAKSHWNKVYGMEIKDSIALFNECTFWNGEEKLGYEKKGFYELFNLAQYLEGEVEANRLSKGFVYSLHEMWMKSFGKFNGDLKKIERCRQVEHEYVPLLKYMLARTFSKDREKMEEMEEKLKPLMPWIRIPVSWVSLRTR